MSMEHANANRIAESYLAVWNETDLTSRLTKLEDGWAANASYSDPLMRGETPHGLATMIENARSQFPGHHFVLRGQPSGYGNVVRFSWDLVGEQGAKVASGTDIVKLDPDGKLAEVIGFLD